MLQRDFFFFFYPHIIPKIFGISTAKAMSTSASNKKVFTSQPLFPPLQTLLNRSIHVFQCSGDRFYLTVYNKRSDWAFFVRLVFFSSRE